MENTDKEFSRFCVIVDLVYVLIFLAIENDRSGVAEVAAPTKAIFTIDLTFSSKLNSSFGNAFKMLTISSKFTAFESLKMVRKI